MKKTVMTLACGALLASTASADFARIEMGVGGWNQTPKGMLSYSDSSGATGTYTSDEKADTGAYAWLLIKHPIPIIPNVRLEYTSIKDSGTSTGSFNDFGLPANVSAPTTFDITQFDIIPYYNILDNTFWMTVDLGIDIKVQQTDYTVAAVTNTTIPALSFGGYSDSSTVMIPMGYLRARVEIPITNIGVESDIKYITYDGSTISDFRAKVDYTFDFVPVVQPAIEVGYRMQHFDIQSDDDKTKMKMDYNGVYAGLMLRF